MITRVNLRIFSAFSAPFSLHLLVFRVFPLFTLKLKDFVHHHPFRALGPRKVLLKGIHERLPFLYSRIAKVRFRLFGKGKVCIVRFYYHKETISRQEYLHVGDSRFPNAFRNFGPHGGMVIFVPLNKLRIVLEITREAVACHSGYNSGSLLDRKGAVDGPKHTWSYWDLFV